VWKEAEVEDFLEQQFPVTNDVEKLERMRQAADDPSFLADLHETMSAFAEADAEWWESEKQFVRLFGSNLSCSRRQK
jgi:hypothetical protein